jgi:hypothetical protein
MTIIVMWDVGPCIYVIIYLYFIQRYFSVIHIIASNEKDDRWMNDELEKMWKETVVA